MSILVNPDAFPQAIRAVYDLAKFMPGTAEEFSRLLVPHSHFAEDERYRDGRDILKSAVVEAKSLGLIHEIDGTLSIVRSFSDDRAYLHALSRAILSAEDKFRSAAEWFLQQDAYTAPKEKTFDDYQKTGQVITQYIPNATQFSNFQRWMRYLGFSRELAGAFVPDPTRAIRNAWGDVVQPGEYPLADLYTKLCGVLPALPVIRDAVIPSSVSFALKSLQRAKLCDFQSHSDAIKWTLTFPHGESLNISHIKITKVKE